MDAGCASSCTGWCISQNQYFQSLVKIAPPLLPPFTAGLLLFYVDLQRPGVLLESLFLVDKWWLLHLFFTHLVFSLDICLNLW
jgi:hypothetical protein